MFRGERRLVGRCDDGIHPQLHQFGHEIGISIEPALGKSALDNDVVALYKPALAQSIEESLARRLRRDGRIIREKADAIDLAGLLPRCRERPSSHRATEQGNELPPSHVEHQAAPALASPLVSLPHPQPAAESPASPWGRSELF